jgi:hypothetical protein
VRNALLYVLANFRKHATAPIRAGLDPCSSAAWFDGWREWAPAGGVPPPFVESWVRRGNYGSSMPVSSKPSTWLAAVGWRRCGLLGVAERPRGMVRRATTSGRRRTMAAQTRG